MLPHGSIRVLPRHMETTPAPLHAVQARPARYSGQRHPAASKNLIVPRLGAQGATAPADDALLVTPPAKPPRGEDTPCAGRTPDSVLSQGKTVARVVAGARVLDLEFAVQQHILRHFQRDEAELLGSVVLDWHGVCRRARALWRCRIAAVSRRVRRLAGMAMTVLQDYTVHKRLQKHAGQSLELSRISCKTKIVCPWHQVWQHCSWRRSAVRAVKVGRHHGLRDSPDTFPHSATHGILWLGGLLQRAHVEET